MDVDRSPGDDAVQSPSRGLLDMPGEILQRILFFCTTPSFIHAIYATRQFFEYASTSREIVLHHLYNIPGIKLGLDDVTARTSDLFLLLRQRALDCLYGANLNADCHEYQPRQSTIDCNASWLAGSDGAQTFFTVAAVLQNSLDISFYDSTLTCREQMGSPYADGSGKILQVVYRENFVSVLYQWDPELEDQVPCSQELLDEEEISRENRSITKINNSPISPCPSRLRKPLCPAKPGRQFHMVHYGSCFDNRPAFFTIQQHKQLVPRHLAVSSQSFWAILWDEEDSVVSPSRDAEIVTYEAMHLPRHQEGVYNAQVVWPPPATTEAHSRKHSHRRPWRIAFIDNGRSLKAYAPGETPPYLIIPTGLDHESWDRDNQFMFGSVNFAIDVPFYGLHETLMDYIEGQAHCTESHLCLGVIRAKRRSRALYIIKIKSRVDFEDCTHIADDSKFQHAFADIVLPVARLWGWSELESNMTGLETISVNGAGSRIAVATWNRVLVYSIDPEILCEDIQSNGDDEDDDKDKNTDTTKKKKRKKSRAKNVVDDFYPRETDPLLHVKVAMLKPIVINLDGAIARKMYWSSTRLPLLTKIAETQQTSSSLVTSNSTSRTHSPLCSPVPDLESVEPTSVPHTGSSTNQDSGIGRQPDDDKMGQNNASTTDREISGCEDSVAILLGESSTNTPKTNQSSEDAVSSQSLRGEPAKIPPSSNFQKHLPLRQKDVNCSQESPSTITLPEIVTSKLESSLGNDGTTDDTCAKVPSQTDGTAEGFSDSGLIHRSRETNDKVNSVELQSPLTPEEYSFSETTDIDRRSDEDESSVELVGRRPIRRANHELVIMTDRSIQVWDFGARTKGIRLKSWLPTG